ncbi:CoA transferase [Rhodococcus sp. WS4]|nr:CoA transferase [Rhodococcus sp. WS4]
MTPLPLADVTVVGIEQAVAAPLATRQLADLGARVIKVERPGGGDFARNYDTVVHGQASAFVWLNRGKESVELDLASPDGQRTLHALLDRADVLVANLSPRALRSLGLDIDSLRSRHPDLIACLISGYPADGPSRDKKAYDALIQAEAGLMSITGSPGAPAKTGISVVDIAAGSFAYSGILAALRHRDRTGEALPVQVSLFEAMTEWMGYPLYYALHSGASPEPMGTSHPTIAPYGAVSAAGGEQVMIAVQNEREWANLCRQVIGRPDLAADPRFCSNSQRVAHRLALDTELASAFATLDVADLLERLDTAQIAWSRLNTLDAMSTHPELTAESRWLSTEIPGAVVSTLRPTATPGGRCAVGGAVPACGEHTAAVLAELQLISEETFS